MARRPAARDVLVALAVGAELQAELLFVDAPRADLVVARLALLALAAAVAFRRSIPVLAAAVTLVAVIVVEGQGDDVNAELVGPFFTVLFVCYSVGAHAEGREWVAAAAVLLGGTIVAVRLDEPPGGLDDILFGLTILTGGPLLLGRLVRARVRLHRALREKAEAVERDRSARAAHAVAGERARIAGELHHVVSAALASMVDEATTAERLARSNPNAAERSLASVEDAGREALGEIRGLLGVLRRGDEELALAPQPSLAHVADLVARVRASGLPVELEVEGTQVPLPAGADLTAYRVVQEALAAAVEAPDARRAAVRLRYREGEVAVEITDVGETPPGRERSLLGIQERVTLYGGELVAEPVSDSGYAVRARLPLERVA
jgi:signal transduction histidine kinase